MGACSCRKGIERDNCPACEGTGQRIDFEAIRRCGACRELVADHFVNGKGISCGDVLVRKNAVDIFLYDKYFDDMQACRTHYIHSYATLYSLAGLIFPGGQ